MAEKHGMNGFALIEVLIALGLAAIVLLGTAEMLIRAIQIRGLAEDRIRLTEAACAQLERLKGLAQGNDGLEIGHHEAAGTAGPKGAIALDWDVVEVQPGTLKVVCRASGAAGERSRAHASVLISARLGF